MIKILAPNGQPATMDYEAEATVALYKNIALNVFKFNVATFDGWLLALRGRELPEGETTMQEAGVSNGDTLHLRLRSIPSDS